MKTFRIVNDDIVIDGQNDISMVEGIDEIAQSIQRVLSTNINEWFLNIFHGLDYGSIQGRGKDIEGIKLVITEAIHQEVRVEEIEFINVDIDSSTRKLKVDFRVMLFNGDIIESKEVMIV